MGLGRPWMAFCYTWIDRSNRCIRFLRFGYDDGYDDDDDGCASSVYPTVRPCIRPTKRNDDDDDDDARPDPTRARALWLRNRNRRYARDSVFVEHLPMGKQYEILVTPRG